MTKEKSLEEVTDLPKDPPAEKLEKPDYLPDNYWNAESGEANFTGFREEYDAMSVRISQIDDDAKDLPENADAYQITLGEEFEIPEGLEFSIEEDPRVEGLKTWAHENKIPQSALNELVKIHATSEIAGLTTARDEAVAERDKLGKNPGARLESVKNAVHAKLAGNPALADALTASLTTADALRAVEKLVGSSQGTPPPNEVTEGRGDDFHKLPPKERLRILNQQIADKSK